MGGLGGSGPRIDELDAEGVAFDNSTNGFTSTEVQSAIEEVQDAAFSASKAFLLAQYNGNANTGRWLEFFVGISSEDAPIQVIDPYKGITIVARTTGNSATCTLEFIDIQVPASPVLLYTLTFTADKEVVVTSTPAAPLFTTAANAQIAVQVGSGSIQKPHLYIVGQGG